MAKLTWDKVGEKLYETGVDRTVLFPMSAGTYEKGVAWSGITAINESPSGAEATKIYADNIVYGVMLSPEEDALTIEAFTYPDEYAKCIGEAELGVGVTVKQQNRSHYGLAYRSLIGNDDEGTKHGYKIHIFYDCVSASSEDSNATINDSPEQKTFSWSVTTIPVPIDGMDPAACIIIDSTKVAEAKLKAIEDLLYGTDGAEPTMPTPAQIKTILDAA